MRLIDADALKANLESTEEKEYATTGYILHMRDSLQIIDAAPTIDAILVEWLDWRIEHARKEGFGDIVKMLTTVRNWWNDQKDLWREEREQGASK